MVGPDAGALCDALEGWLPTRRWWPAKGRAVTLRPVGWLPLPADEGGVDVQILLLALHDAAGGAMGHVVQAPLTCRAAPAAGLDDALVARLGNGASAWVYDGVHDPAFVSAWVNLLIGEEEVRDPDHPGSAARGVRHPGGQELAADRPARVLGGEQSNTSIVVDGSVIIKLFRILQPGENPDVHVTTALAAGGCRRVARPLGWVEGSWPDPTGTGLVHGHMAYASEFLADSEDGWRSACRAVAAGVSFAAEAAELGAATAEVHSTLATVLPTFAASPARLADLADHLSGRLRWAVEAAPALDDLRADAQTVFDAVRTLDPTPARAPVWQRIHGDYHLGQVLHSPSRGWILLDFEGEPLTPVAERSRPDLALRDVAGMLRSFDYAAQHEASRSPAGATTDDWVRECRAAFLGAYRRVARGPDDPVEPWEDVLLRAFEVDKALYEVVYETWNRPHWADRPLDALRRLLRR